MLYIIQLKLYNCYGRLTHLLYTALIYITRYTR